MDAGILTKSGKLDWLDGENIRPYVFVREDNRVKDPGTLFDSDWFPFPPVRMNPLNMDEVSYANQILALEHKAFSVSGLEMPRWVFYDCAILPGFVAGFAHKTETLPDSIIKVLQPPRDQEWTPLSLFIIIPTMASDEWVAHNLCSVNSLLPREQRVYGLGFLTKAFALWFANIQTCCGITQWKSPARRLHSHYGKFEVLTAYTPVHDYAQTLTYRLNVDPSYWAMFFTKQPDDSFHVTYEEAGFKVEPTSDDSLKSFQRRIEGNEGPFYLDSMEVRDTPIEAPLKVYRPRSR